MGVLAPVSRREIAWEEPNLAHFLTSQKKRLEIGQSRARPTINCRFDSARSDSATTPQLRARKAWLEANYRLRLLRPQRLSGFRNQGIDHRREASGDDRTNCSEQCRKQLLATRVAARRVWTRSGRFGTLLTSRRNRYSLE